MFDGASQWHKACGAVDLVKDACLSLLGDTDVEVRNEALKRIEAYFRYVLDKDSALQLGGFALLPVLMVLRQLRRQASLHARLLFVISTSEYVDP